MDNKDTGILLSKKDIELHRAWFKQMTKLLGINVIYRAPIKSKHWDGYGELESYYYDPEVVGSIFEDHPKQSTMKKLGWNHELSESLTLIHVPYDLHDIQVGALFDIPSWIDNTPPRRFRVVKMHVDIIYPASITCELAPVIETTFERSKLTDFEHSDLNLLNDEEGE